VLVYGGAALSRVTPDAADRSIRFALDVGINHFDTAADYGDSELHLGRWMPRIRDRIFLATKTGDRAATGAYDSIRRSLDRLQTDGVDLLQLHAVGDLAELDRVMGPDGAVEGAVRAREEGIVGAIGITGHGMRAPATHVEALRRFPFDTVLTPWNWRLAQDPHYRGDFEVLVGEVGSRDAGLLIIKAVARNLWREGEQNRSTWYEPLEDQGAIEAAVAFVLSRPEVTAIATPADVDLLPGVVEAERRRSAWSAASIDEAMSGVEEYEPPFVHTEGRVVPAWLAPLVTED
jgi:aryl-alcohol dehydrogenase-like predicted oxidoreductase